MPFVNEILKYKSLSIVGLEKNTGKTECLNYILRRLEGSGRKLALTSIGVDGEKVDAVTGTSKPETELYESLIFITSEKHYKQRRINAEILDISSKSTALGRLITARALSKGKVIFSGPSDTLWLKEIIVGMKAYDIETTIVDGAISRLSHGSPVITESMILNTGAAVSANIPNLLNHTKFIYELIKLPAYVPKSIDPNLTNEQLLAVNSGIYSLKEDGQLHDLKIPSVFLLKQHLTELFKYGNVIYITGAVSDRMLDFIRMQRDIKNVTLVVKDFTRLFIKPETYRTFNNCGHRVMVLVNTKLLAVCVNPVSPSGYILHSEDLCNRLSDALDLPVYDIKKQ